MFSSRLRHGSSRNRLAVALDRRRAAGLPIVDLTLSNPTRAGFVYPAELLHALANERGLRYEPHPFGMPSAREAVANDYSRRGSTIPPEQIVLTASTSEAYSLLLKLLCDPGDAVLAPRPSYPLVEHLTDLEAVALEPYSLEYHGAWSIDLDDVRERCASTTVTRPPVRAIIVISPNNPTGSIVKPHEAHALSTLAREHELALIVDEVFADYPLERAEIPAVWTRIDDAALTFRLGGFSKTIGLPQMKLGWMGITGPATLVAEAMERLETICDTYLSVSTPVQAAAADLFKHGAVVRGQIQARIATNLAHLKMRVSSSPACTMLRSEAGWHAVVQVPAIKSEETLMLDALDRTGVLVHPGYFFDFPHEAFLIVSLLPESTIFAQAVDTLFGEIGSA
jgi:alanine-synthesizing transaminase